MKSKKTDKTKETASYLSDSVDYVGEIAIHYGFTPIKPPSVVNSHITKIKQLRDYDTWNDADEKVTMLEWYFSENMQSKQQPLSFFFKKPLQGSTENKKSSEELYGLEIMGSGRSECEALIIKTLTSTLSDLGYKNICVDINSIGDRESISRFDRELGTYLRKHSQEFPTKIKEDLRKNPYGTLSHSSPEIEEIRGKLPQTVGSLSEAARIHFKEVLEYLEIFGVPYKINHSVLPNKFFASFTCFEIREIENQKTGEEGSLLAYGYRYNYLGRKIGIKRDIPCIGATLIVKKEDLPKKKTPISKMKKPHFYLAQLGNTAKLKALNIIEFLRKNKIPVYHSLTKDKMVGQLSGSDYSHASHVLIIGQKEAIDNTVVVRNVLTREQETVKVSDLPNFLKKLK